MRASIARSEIAGKVLAPSSKSYTIRGLLCAALAKGKSEIINPLGSDDTEASLDILSKVGIGVLQGKDSWQVRGGDFRAPDTGLFCRESAATLRFMAAVCSLIPGQCRLTSAPSLAARPIEPLLQALKQLGVDCYQNNKGSVVVKGGKLKGGVTELPGNISSQFVSALLFISPFAEEGVKIRVTTLLESQPFVLMTLECLKRFGIRVDFSENLREFETTQQRYQPAKYSVEGDWSSASYLLALGALCGEVEVENLDPESLQGDKAILDFLRDMGATVTTSQNSVTVSRSRLKAIRANLSDCIDLLPTLAVLTAAAEGTSVFTGIERARLKESDRPSALREGLEGMGIKVTEEKNELTITGSPATRLPRLDGQVVSRGRRAGSPARGAVIDTRGDHRIAMAFSLLGLSCGGTIIDDAECVAKTYPEFWDTLKSIGGKVKIDGK